MTATAGSATTNAPLVLPAGGGSFTAAVSEQILKGQLFTPRWGLSAATLQGKVYVFGGYLWCYGLEGFFQDLYELDLSTAIVKRILPEGSSSGAVPVARFGHTLIADPARNQLLLFGGRNAVESFRDLWAFNVSKGVWTQLAPGPSSASKALAQANTPLSSGAGDDSHSSSSSRRSKNGRKGLDRDLKGAFDNSVGLMVGPEPRSWHSAVVYRNALHIYGGWDQHNRVYDDMWAFDLSLLQWSRIDPPDAMSQPPHGRSCHQTALWSDHLYIFGGLRDGNAVTNDMWRFSFDTRIWTPVECTGTRPAGRTSAAGVVVGDSWLIHGGLNDFPRAGMAAIAEVIEFNFATNTWIQRAVLLSESAAAAAKRYGHVALAMPNSTAVVLLGGAEKFAVACPVAAVRVDLLPSQSQVCEMQQDLYSITRVSQLNRERVAEIVEVVQSFEGQIRQLKTENAALAERCQNMQSQMASLHQQQSALQASFQAVQQGLAAVEQFIPMMRSVGAAIANFGNVASAQSSSAASWSAPGSTASLNTARSQSGLQSAGDLNRYKATSE